MREKMFRVAIGASRIQSCCDMGSRDSVLGSTPYQVPTSLLISLQSSP